MLARVVARLSLGAALWDDVWHVHDVAVDAELVIRLAPPAELPEG